MPYYDALIAKWPTVTGANTAARLANLNGQTVPAPAQQMLVPRWRIWNAIVESEWTPVSAANKTLINEMFSQMDVLDVSSNTRARNRLLTVFTQAAAPQTRTAFNAIAATFDTRTQPWWSASVADGGGGLSSPVNESDLTAAGLI